MSPEIDVRGAESFWRKLFGRDVNSIDGSVGYQVGDLGCPDAVEINYSASFKTFL